MYLKCRVYSPIQETNSVVEKIDWTTDSVYTKDGETYALDIVKILPYTCFNDKDGNEVYEGDILQYGDSKIRVIYDVFNSKFDLLVIEGETDVLKVSDVQKMKLLKHYDKL